MLEMGNVRSWLTLYGPHIPTSSIPQRLLKEAAISVRCIHSGDTSDDALSNYQTTMYEMKWQKTVKREKKPRRFVIENVSPKNKMGSTVVGFRLVAIRALANQIEILSVGDFSFVIRFWFDEKSRRWRTKLNPIDFVSTAIK